MTFSIRPADPAELRRVAAFLPRWEAAPGDECLVAEADDPKRIIGMAMLRQQSEPKAIPDALLDLGVLPRFRDQGVIRQLVALLLERAQVLGCAKCSLVSPQTSGTPEFIQLIDLGFSESRRLVTYGFSLPGFASRTQAVFDRLSRHGAIPGGAKVVPLTTTLWPSVVQLLRAEQLVDRRLQKRVAQEGIAASFSPASLVLLLGGRVKGAALNHGRGRQLETSALAIAPELRGGNGWANAMLTARAAQISLALGHEVLTMSADPVQHPMTTRLARRMCAAELFHKIFLQHIC